jgi:heat shock protein HslJ
MRHVRTPIIVVLLLAACSAVPSGGGVGGNPLDGHDFLSTSVTEDGADRPLVDGTRIRISFDDGQLGASAGCNTLGGAYRLEGGVLVFEGGGMTEMGCDEPRHAQDDWLTAFLGSGPTIVQSGTDLTLSADGTVITLQDSEVVEPDLPLTGTTWTVDSIIAGEAVSSVPGGAVATITFGDDGSVEVNTGCNQGAGRFEVSGETLHFVDVAVTEMACDGPGGQLEAAVLPVLGADGLTWAIDAGTLTLMAGDNGLGLRGQ